MAIFNLKGNQTMKTTFRLIGAVATVAALFSSCKKEAFNEDVKPGTVDMTIIAGADDETRTVLGSDGAVTWSASGEQLAVMEVAVSGTETTTAKETSEDGVIKDKGATMSFGVSMPTKKADSFVYYALYPNSAYVDKPSDFTNVKVNLASTQAPTESSFGPSADVLVAKPVTYQSEQPTELNLQFARVIAVGKMTIKNLNTTENVKKVIFTATEKAVTGSRYIDFTTAAGVEYGDSSYGVDNVVLDYSDKTIAANEMTAHFTCWPFELTAGDTFSVVVETDTYAFTKKVTLAEGKSLAFKVGRASTFSVDFRGIEGVEHIPDGAYVVACGENMMTVGTTSNSYRGVATLPETANEDGSYFVDATAAWNFVYDSATDTYKIYSASDNSLYIQGSSSDTDFKLVAKESATSFTITKNEDGTYRIARQNTSRYIGYNYNNGTNPRFAMYASSSKMPGDLNLYRAKFAFIPKITVQETLEVPNAGIEASFPVTLTNVADADVKVYKNEACTIIENEWITANLNTESTAIEYTALENTTSEARTAYIRIYALSLDGNEATAIVTVTQDAAGSASKKTVTYTVTSTSAVTASGVAPSGSIATYSSTYSSKYQLTDGKSMTLTLSGYKGMIVKGLTLSMKSNSSSGAGYLSVNAGDQSLGSIGSSSSGVKFSDALWNGEWSTSYVDVTPKLTNSAYTVQKGENLVIVIGATTKSLYCQSFTIEYVADPSLVGGSEPKKLDPPVVTCTAKTETSLTFSWDAVDKASGYQVSTDGGITYGSTQKATTYNWTGLTANTTKKLYVKAIGDGTNYIDSDAAYASGTTTAGSGSGEGGTKKYYEKVTSEEDIVDGGKYLIVYNGNVANGFTNDTYLTVTNVTVENDRIDSNTTIDSYAFTINSVKGGYTLKIRDNYIGYKESTKFSKSTTVPTSNKFYWTFTVQTNNYSVLIKNVGTDNRFIGANSSTSVTQFRAYNTSNVDTYPQPTLYQLAN